MEGKTLIGIQLKVRLFLLILFIYFMGLKALFQVETDLSSITSGKAKCVLPE
jgi:hypothetical protein